MRAQVGALCYRYDNGKLRVLLVKTKRKGHWVVPKGWAEDGLTPAQSASKEAYEEAGVEGHARDCCVGFYTYDKDLGTGKTVPCMVAVFPLLAQTCHTTFPESGLREHIWCSRNKAAELVASPVLGNLIKTFDPTGLDD